MPEVLFIAYDFPPSTSIGGSLRSEKFVKYLNHYNWQPRILALQEKNLPDGEIFPHVTRIPSLTPLKKPYQITPYGWLPNLNRVGKRVLKEKKIDVIYVSCPPFLHIKTAVRLKLFAGIPLVVDFRDAWSLDPYMEGSLLKKLLYRSIFPMVEKKVLTQANYFIVNCPSSQTAYLHRYPFLRDHIVTIHNGYDEDDFIDYQPSCSKHQMNLLYVGRFMIGNRNPQNLLKGFKQVVEKCDSIRLSIIGSQSNNFLEQVRDYGLITHVELLDQVPHVKAVRALARSSALVLYQEPTQAVISPIAGKTFEYLRAGKPILAIAPPGDNLDMVRRYASRYECVTDNDPNRISQAIRSLYSDWQDGSLLPFYPVPKRFIKRFNRKSLTGNLATIFNNVKKN